MAIQHKNIADAERHEPKGISTALIDTVYVSNGAATGVWKELPFIVSAVLDDVSTADFVLVPIPVNVTIQSIRFVLSGPITVANSTITVTRGGDSAAMGTKSITFAGSAEGSVFDLAPSNNTIDATTHGYIKIATNGASTDLAKLFISIKCKAV